MRPLRLAIQALLPFLLHGVARSIDATLGILLHSTLDLPGFVAVALALVDPLEVVRSAALWTAAGLVLWTAGALLRARSGGGAAAAFASEARLFAPLYLRPIVTLAAIGVLAMRATYPFAATLPVALTQDLGIAQDAMTLAALIALRWRPLSLPVPTVRSIFVMAFLVGALSVPDGALRWEGHPGNEPKYLRMAVAIGDRLSLDVEGIEATVDAYEPAPFLTSVGGAARTLATESARMLAGLFASPSSLSREAIQASRLGRQTIYGKEGGIYQVLAPGPSLAMAPLLRVDRWLNRLDGQPGRLRATLLGWNALSACLVAMLFVLVRDATQRPGLAAALTAFFALTPPFVFYSFQFYPEMPGALLLAFCIWRLYLRPSFGFWSSLGLGLGLAALPWLHQKFLPVWAVLAAVAIFKAVDRLVGLRALLALALPQLATLYLVALYNFAITGSARPDALFLAWGPGGITTAHLGQGFFGLLLDIHYGILPYAPVYLLGVAALWLPLGKRIRPALLPVAVYYLTVAAADDWHGAVSNLGRYFMPVAPFVVALVAIALRSVSGRRGSLTVALFLFFITARVTLALWLDPHAANDASLLVARSTFLDGWVYIPNLLVSRIADGGMRLIAQLGVWLVLAALLTRMLLRAARSDTGPSVRAVVVGACGLLLAASIVLERWPSQHRLPRLRDGVEITGGTTAFASGPVRVDAPAIRAWPGESHLLVRSGRRLERIAIHASGVGTLAPSGRVGRSVPGHGLWDWLDLELLADLKGRRGVEERLYQARFEVSGGDLGLRLALRPGEPLP